MASVWLAVADESDAQDLRGELEDFGITPRILEGCDQTLDAVQRSSRKDLRTLVIDSKLIAALAVMNRNLIDEIVEVADPGLRVMVVLTKPGQIDNVIVQKALSQSHAVVHAPATPTDVRLRIRSLSRT